MLRCPLVFATFVMLFSAGCGGVGQPAETTPQVPKLIDLTYSLDQNTIYWPNNKAFQHEQVAYGISEGGYWYASFTFAASEHGGTHLDAPIHFAEGKQSVEQIPIERHVGPGVKISIAEKAAQDRARCASGLQPSHRLRPLSWRSWPLRIPASPI